MSGFTCLFLHFCILLCFVAGNWFWVEFYSLKTLECIDIPGFFGVFKLLTVSAFG